MPTWSFRNNDTEEEFDEFFSSYNQKEAFLAENPHVEQLIGTAPAIVSGVGMSGPKTDDGFKDLLGRIKKGNPRNTIKT